LERSIDFDRTVRHVWIFQEKMFRMSSSIVMPQLGLTMTEGTVSEWLKKPGDFVRKNEPVLLITTDKAEMEVESLVEGTLGEILVEAGATVPVGTTLANLQGGEEDDIATVANAQPSAETLQECDSAETKAAPHSAAAQPTVSKVDRGLDRPLVSPRAKRLAKELGVETANLRGSGANGEIVEEDIKRAGFSQSKTSQSATSQSKTPKPNLRKRQLIAERLTRSIQTIPTFSVAAEANAEKLVALHEKLRQSPPADGVKLTITDLLLNIFADVLKRSPELCATWENNEPRDHSSIDIGLAVATPSGVVAPVLRNVDKLDLPKLVIKRNELAEKARGGKLVLTELEGGISTLSNLGMYRVDHFEALISPGQSSILAVGSIRKRPWAAETLVIRPTVILNLTVDHRIADGAAAAAFLSMLVEKVEEPSGQNWKTGLPSGDGANRG
jgi:pyruvate dehydrogenase E2 component (dihydrolipoamide acetyltransferase)